MRDIILQQVFPTLGIFTGTFMSFAPFRAVLKASRDGHLGDLNPTPWVFMLGNCCGWLAYSYLLQNMYVFLPNASGFILAIWLNIQAIKLQYENHRSVELQQAIIDALEVLDRSKHREINKKAVTELVEQVIIEDPVVDMLDPSTTAPVVTEEEPYQGRTSLVQQDEETTDSAYTNYSATGNNHSPASASDGDVENDLKKNNTAAADEEEEGGFTMLDFSNRAFSFLGNNETTVQEAAEAMVDYATFIWDIAAQRTPAPVSHELMVVAISTVWLLLITVVVFSQHVWEESTRILIIGITVNANLIFFYGAPLSKIATVLETRCSKLIHVPTMVCSLMNGTLWFVYGVEVKDYFIAVPNGLGAALGVVQLIFCLTFPRHHAQHDYSTIGQGGEGSTLVSNPSSSTLSLPQESAPLI